MDLHKARSLTEKMAQLDWVRAYLAIGPRPYDELDWQALRRAEVTLIIDLNDSALEGRKARELGIQHKGLVIGDPSTKPETLMTSFHQVCDWIEEERSAGGKVYLHCTAGQQRSPTCAMAYLMAKGETRQSAERIVKAARLGVWAGPASIAVLEKALELWAHELAKEMR